MYPVDIAETLEDFEQKPLVMVFRLLAKEEAAETAEEPVEEAAPEAAEPEVEADGNEEAAAD